MKMFQVDGLLTSGEKIMKFTKKRPTGFGTQFVAVWEYEGKIWSSTYKYSEQGLEEYKEEFDDFRVVDENYIGWVVDYYPVKFVIK